MTTPQADVDQPPKKRSIRWWHWLLALTSAFLLLVAMGLVWLISRNASASAKVAEKLKSIQSKGEPYDNESLNDYYRRLTSDKNLDQWLQLLDNLKSKAFVASSAKIFPWDFEAVLDVDNSKEWKGERETNEFLKQWTDVRRLAHRLALQNTIVRLPMNFDGPETNHDYVTRMRELARLFQLESQVAIRNRNSAAAVESILCLLGAARAIEAQPTLVGQLICMAIEGIALGQIQSAIEQDAMNERDLRILLARVQARTKWSDRWRTALVGERAIFMPVFDNPEKFSRSLSGGDRMMPLPWRSKDRLAFLEVTEKALDFPTDDLTSFMLYSQKLESDTGERMRDMGFLTMFDEMLFRLVLPAYGAVAEAFVRNEMENRLAMLGISVRIYQKKFKRFPDKLVDLKDIGLNLDECLPVGGKPFGYRLANNQVTLWGFRLQTDKSTPAEPPVVDEETQLNQMWVWELKE